MTKKEISHFPFKCILIKKDTTINGNGHSIDASGLSSMFFVGKGTNVTLENVVLKNGHIDCSGGNLLGNGGAIVVGVNALLNLKNCTLINNNAQYNGGAISLQYKTAKANIDNCSFIGNSATSHGGAIYSGSGENDVNITNCYFKENSAKRGGAIYQVSVQNSTFEKNTAKDTGGAMYCNDAYNCYFKENNANRGGAIFGSTAIHSTFDRNTAKFGDAIYSGDAINSTFINVSNKNSLIYSGNYAYSNIENCTFNYLNSDNTNDNGNPTPDHSKENNIAQFADNISTISKREILDEKL
ncbi:hypothetical protein [uncultured Methanobrevibacter sp.]|uniref:hypothetical protein n=1 Tax=uncultured Methanobrevibacter sp. TaxID=253161 RepID=UPI0026005241|nr:hypothetical protein [uncultured Methanobrevibacter sp.]